ncbi:MAG: CHASE2 domain-containing protein [Nitrospira sp.]
MPLLDSGSMLINYLGPPSSPSGQGPFTIVSFHEVIRSAFDPVLVKDRIVLMGLTVRGLDEFATPTTATTRMWGVEVLDNAVETLLAQRYLIPAAPALTISVILGFALLSAWLVAVVGPHVWPPRHVFRAVSLSFDRGSSST